MAKYRPQRICFTLEYTPPDDIDVEAFVNQKVHGLCDEVGEAVKRFIEATPGLVVHNSSVVSERLDEKQPYEG